MLASTRLAKSSLQFVDADLCAFQILHGQFIVKLGDLLNHMCTSFFSLLLSDPQEYR